jgi:HSP20 family protein
MYNNHACAAKGEYGTSRHFGARSLQRAAINIHKTEQSFEVLVFAPGRVKEHFHLDVKGNQLTVSYTPPEGFPRPDWVLREYSRGGFVRSISLSDAIDADNIRARYTDGVLEISLPLTPQENVKEVHIPIQ